jgi:flagellar biosynthesis protein FliQ
MTDATVMDILRKALTLTVTVGAPVLCIGLVVGVIVSVFQAATQIHEMSLTFIPKIIAVAVAVLFFGQWMLTQVTTFTVALWQGIPALVR